MIVLGPDIAAYIDTQLEMYWLRNCPSVQEVLLSAPEWEMFCQQNGFSLHQEAYYYFNRAGVLLPVRPYG